MVKAATYGSEKVRVKLLPSLLGDEIKRNVYPDLFLDDVKSDIMEELFVELQEPESQ